MERLFIAIEIPQEIKSNFQKLHRDLSLLKNSNVVPFENIHLTLKFIGETDKRKDILEILENVKFSRFEITLEKTGVFPNLYYPRVFWVGVRKNPELNNLFNLIENKLENLDIPKETRNFSPHITLCRFKGETNTKKLENLILDYEKTTFGTFEVQEVILFKSHLRSPHPLYEKIFYIHPT